MAVQAMIANADGFFTLALQLLTLPGPKDESIRLHPRRPGAFIRELCDDGVRRSAHGHEPCPPLRRGEQAGRPAARNQGRRKDSYQKIVKDIASNVFRKDRLLADVPAIEGATKAIRRA